MTDNFYSFDDTDALLASLSSSSATTLSPSDNGEFSSGNSAKASSYGYSPENDFLTDEYWGNQVDGQDSKTLNDDFYSKDFVNFDGEDNSNIKTEIQNDNGFQFNNNDTTTFDIPKINTDLKSQESETPSQYNDNNQLPQSQSLKKESSSEESDFSPEATTTTYSSSASALKKTIGDNNKITKPKKTKATHNVIEKKYRTNINSKITALRDAVPSLRLAAGDVNTTLNDLDGLSPAAKVNKAIVLEKATEYIQHLEKKNMILLRENQQMKQYLGSIPAQQQHYPSHFNQQIPLQQQQQQQQQHDNFQPATYNGQQVNVANAQPQQQYQMGVPARVLMGGMATMVGHNMFNGGNDFSDYRGLSAFPILGNPLFAKLLHIIQFSFLASSVVSLIFPSIFASSDSNLTDKSGKPQQTRSSITLLEWYELVKELVFIRIGSKSKHSASGNEIDTLVNQSLLGKFGNNSYFSLVFLLLRLFTYETSYEVSFAKLVLAKLILTYSDFSLFFNLNSLVELSISEVANQKVSDPALRHFFKELKSPLAKDSEAFKRLLNVVTGLPISTNCERGVEDKGFFLILRDDRISFDYKTLLVSFRANEVFREVLLEYINLTFNKEEINKLDNDELKEGKKELWNKLISAENLAPKRSVVDIRIKLFKSILNEKYVDGVLKLVSEESKAYTLNQKLNGNESNTKSGETISSPVEEEEEDITTSKEENVDGEDLEKTDEQIYDSDEYFEDSDFEPEPITPSNSFDNSKKNKITEQPLINAKFQNLLSQDLFNALVCSSILKYAHADQHEQVSKLLKYIRFNKDELTLLSFISLYKLIQKFPKKWVEGKEGQVIENLVAHLRVWIGDSSNGNFNDLKEVGLHLKREISDDLVETGKSFNELN
ncbi:hypothetical protein BN7_5372 [Wickerhamomyces ciferrii]|uniref:BHLH domain-containing protein n=1 Tax=Wickerhamomyces ciferrii (strain ATCC 14091 / BCRC 22168 / CBS 111 / JCM 3599 / NBRC 0793 / NRRL Y-1031 F-60-10) TaxID=1206466 RepID=K0KRR0_WICCF|nr:uncharacterized protein BN7_5372 [Wickerhamomyces ciferrii]CCH45786.1 hypothetical protein BN7_5372 [Wickerhamomyces ciferrii]